MRVRIHRPEYRLDFEGAPAVWNALLRPILGGPEAPPDPVAVVAATTPAPVPAAAPAPVVRTVAPPPSAAPAAQGAGVRTWFPPREPREPRDHDDVRSSRPAHPSRGDAGGSGAPWRRRGGPEPEARIEPSNDPAEVYGRLEALGSRRAEKDAVLAAVWFVGGGEREVHEREIEAHFEAHGGPVDAKVKPQVLKHINRTKLLEPGTKAGLVRLTGKGREYVRLLCGV